jgi:predicted DNA-binding protein (MmcQ/YjbR family)
MIPSVHMAVRAKLPNLGRQLKDAGYLLSYMSGYLLERNWLQICLMGEISEAELHSLVEALRGAIVDLMSREPNATLQATWSAANFSAQREAR